MLDDQVACTVQFKQRLDFAYWELHFQTYTEAEEKAIMLKKEGHIYIS